MLEQFGLDYDVVRAIRPDVVMVRMPAFGLTGPWRDRPGFAQTMEQLTGMAWVTGYEGGPPIIPGGLVDPMVGAHAALAIVAALEHRDRTGEGQLVEVPLLEVATAVTAEQVIRYAIDGTLLDRRGAGGVYRDARRRRRGSRSTARPIRCRPSERADVVRDARRRGRGAPSCARRASPAAAMVPRLRDARRSADAGARVLRADRQSARRRAASTRRGRCACRPGPRATGPVPRRRSASTPTRCCATSSASTDDELARLRDEHVIGTTPYFG